MSTKRVYFVTEKVRRQSETKGCTFSWNVIAHDKVGNLSKCDATCTNQVLLNTME